jgi:hypothetical protein
LDSGTGLHTLEMDGLLNGYWRIVLGHWRRIVLWFIVSIVVGLLSVLSPAAILYFQGRSLDLQLFYAVSRDGSLLVFSIVLLLTGFMEFLDASPTYQPGLGFGFALCTFLLAFIAYISNATELLV